MQITKVLFSFFIIILIFVLSLFLGPIVLLCEGTDQLPVAALFENLHLTDNFASAINSLKGFAGVYCIRCLVTGAMYIGSTTNLSKRINVHFLNSSNVHLRNAIIK
jgi:heme/copper-type cytochrome/quinol oxidase subunit 4